MEKQKQKKEFEDYLDSLYDLDMILEKTEHIWGCSHLSEMEKQDAWSMANRGYYANCLRCYDPVAYDVAFHEYLREGHGHRK